MYIKRFFAILSLNIVIFSLFSNADKETKTVMDRPLLDSFVSEEPVSFTYFNIFNNMPFNSEWPVFKRASELTNVSLIGIASQSSSDESSAFNLMISTGNLPDIIGHSQASKLDALGRDGGLTPLNSLIKEHAPDLQRLLDEHSDYKAAATALDGNIYFIPKFMEAEVAMGYYIRTDWLKKLNLMVPQTIPELYNVLKAFRNMDPNGNGLKDEIPMFKRNGNANIWDLFGIWGAASEFDLKDGKIVYGPIEEEFKIAMETLIKWYREELIDPEIFTRGYTARDTLLGQNVGGFTHDWFGSTANYNKLTDKIDGFEFKPMIPVINQNGERLEKSARHHVPGWGISTACKDPVTLIKYFNFFFTPDGHKLINYGIEGDTYYLENGEPVYTDKIMKSDETALTSLRSNGVQFRIGMLQDFAYEKGWLNQIALNGMQMYIDGGYVKREIPSNSGILLLKYTPEQEKEYIKIMSQITTYTLEMIQKWMLVGSSDFEKEYPTYIKSLEKKGINRAIEINQLAYNIYINRYVP
ncbi:MAG: extracellular solute-binding protein [Spirochaetaceae bacterium]